MFRGVKAARVVEEIYFFGVRSLSIVLVASFFVGMVLALQISIELKRFGVTRYIANVVCISLVRELGPIFTALLLAGRAGSGIAAEIGSLKITEQISAMKMLGLRFTRYFSGPMIIATTFSAFALTVVFDAVGILGGYVIGIFHLGIPFATYHASTLRILQPTDVITGLAKAVVFGAVVGVVGCTYGLKTRGGGKGVGEYTKRSVVTASLIILVSDFFLTKLLVFLLE
jgi:phospholipid/cholesterol/gamma-HCH transport system permease protein